MTVVKCKQNINGILLLNKPKGITSNTALQQAKRLFGAKKAGHTGSLDPLATGMLPICFGESTKVCQYVLDADKCYETTGQLGVKTNTADAMGDVIARVDSFSVSQKKLQEVLSQFIGKIQQIPSMYSALKHQGQPLYKLARAGIEIERKSREITIYSLILDKFDGVHLDLTVTCSKGTYIRNLIEDIGDRLEVGAHVTRLHRLYTAGFENELMYTFEDFESLSPEERLKCLLPTDHAVAHYPAIFLNDEEAQALKHGKRIMKPVDERNIYNGFLRLYDSSKHFIGLGELAVSGELKVKRLLGIPNQ